MTIRRHALLLNAGCPDPWQLARCLGIRILFGELPHGALEAWRPDRNVIILDERLCETHYAWYLAHALGHVALHCGSQPIVARWGIGWEQKQESDADRFTAIYLAPTLADLFKLPADKRAFRVRLEAICGLRAA